MERPVEVFAKRGHRRVQALDGISGVDHARQWTQDAKRLHECPEVVKGCRRQETRRDEGLHLAVARFGRRPRAVAIQVEDKATPVGRRPGAHVHHRGIAEPSAEMQVDAARGTGRISRHLHQWKRWARDVALERCEVRERDHKRRDRDA